MGPDDLLHSLCHELGLEVDAQATRHQLLTALHACLIRHARVGLSVVVCIDEAQAIPVRTVESLRLLSNLETEKRKLLQLVLLGQPELDVKLQRPEIRQLLQRITFSEYLGPMQPRRVASYLAHRLATAALDETTDTGVFEPAAAAAIASFSGGVPRLVNVLAHKCLMLAYGENEHRVQLRHVKLAALDTPGVTRHSSRWRLWWHRLMRRGPPLADA